MSIRRQTDKWRRIESLAGPRCPEVEQDKHVAGRQAVHAQLIQRLLRGGSAPLPLPTRPPGPSLLLQTDALLQGLPEEVPQQEGRAHGQVQDDARLLHAGRKEGKGEGNKKACLYKLNQTF